MTMSINFFITVKNYRLKFYIHKNQNMNIPLIIILGISLVWLVLVLILLVIQNMKQPLDQGIPTPTSNNDK